MEKRAFLFRAAVIMVLIILSVGLGVWCGWLRTVVGRGFCPLGFGGRCLLEVRAPHGSAVLPMGGVEVLVGFREGAMVLPETFRCLLNNDDVTERLTLGENGAGGRLYGLVEGENRIRFEVFGQGWWPGRYFEDVREVILHITPLPNIDRALAPAGEKQRRVVVSMLPRA